MKLSRKKIRQIIAAAFWLSAGVCLVVFLIAAMKKRDDKTCAGMNIEISDVKNNLFADKNDIAGMIINMCSTVKGKPVKDFDLQFMEKTLENNMWIKDAELFFDNNEMLQVKIKERQPIARIFTTTGKSFYIDNDWIRLPLSNKFSARVPAFTNCPLDKTKWNATDSTLLNQIQSISSFLEKNNFWAAQIEQIDFSEKKQFELYPQIGEHKIVFGNGDNLETKFKKLYIFYKEVLAKTGWNTYSIIDVQYKEQVVATKKDSTKSAITFKPNIYYQQSNAIN
jgi:cell division protein FtsQ